MRNVDWTQNRLHQLCGATAAGVSALLFGGCISTTVDLSTAFNRGYGYVLGDLGSGGGTAAFHHIVDSKGRIVLAGYQLNAAGDREAVIWRYSASGRVDTAWGGADGAIVYNEGLNSFAGSAMGASKYDSPLRMLEDAQGNYLLIGESKDGSGGLNLVLWRVNSVTGALDTSFGGGTGYYIFGGAAGATVPGARSGALKLDGGTAHVGVDASGRIYATLHVSMSPSGSAAPVFRLTSAGVLDTSYGSPNGYYVATTSYSGNATVFNRPQAMLVQSDGTVYLAAYSANSGSTSSREPVLVKLTSSGVVDTSFGTSGVAIIGAGASGVSGAASASKRDYPVNGSTIAIDSLGRILIAGSSQLTVSLSDVVIWALKSDGSGLDTSFGSSPGYTTFNLGGSGLNGAENASKFDFPRSLQIAADGTLMVAGHSRTSLGGQAPFIVKLSRNGTWDTTYGSSGVVSYLRDSAGTAGAPAATKLDYLYSMNIDHLGRLMCAGMSNDSALKSRMVAWRFTAAGDIDR